MKKGKSKMDRDSFVMHRNFLEGIPEEEQFKWFKTICEYAFNSITPDFDNWLEKKIWKNIQDRIENDREAYEVKKERNRQKVNKWRQEHGIAPKNDVTVTEVTDGYSGVQEVTLGTPCVPVSEFEFKSESEFKSDYDYVSESVSVLESDREVDSSSPAPSKKVFVKPSPEEVKQYVDEKGYTFDPGAFYSFYESNGWKVGKNSMKDWKAACKTWQQREKTNPQKPALDTVDPSRTEGWETNEW